MCQTPPGPQRQAAPDLSQEGRARIPNWHQAKGCASQMDPMEHGHAAVLEVS